MFLRRIILCLSLMGFLCFNKADSTWPAVVSIDVANESISIGDIVMVNISVSDVSDLYGFQVSFTYDPDILDVIDANHGNFLSRGISGCTYWVTPVVGRSGKFENAASTRLKNIGGVTGDGVLVAVNFKAVDDGISDIALNNVILVDSTYLQIPATLRNARVKVEFCTMSNLAEMKVYPNPVSTSRHANKITFDNLTDNVSIKIFNIAGECVWEVEDSTPPGGFIEWDLRNKSGKEVANGLYIYLITNKKDEKKTGKLAIKK